MFTYSISKVLAFYLLFHFLPLALGTSQCCKVGQSCWPTATQLQQLNQQLDPTLNRTLIWAGTGTPYPSAIPLNSTNNQPLYGAGAHLNPLYISNTSGGNQSIHCFVDDFSDFCLVSTRNSPYEYEPAFIAWPTTIQHVQTLVRFAATHHLCICVTGTGHDFLNRHNCNQGILIRMTLFQSITWNLRDSRCASGTAKVGSGLTWGQVHKLAADNNRVVASGWASTVGVAGWSNGGGHGPLNPRLGLGADNVLEIELVTANGEFIVANSTQNSDLFWAIRGGGGSTWGIITSYTIRAHPIPSGGFSAIIGTWSGLFCNEGRTQFNDFVDDYLAWSLTLSRDWGGLCFLNPTPTDDSACLGNWSVLFLYVYQGSVNESEYQKQWNKIMRFGGLTPDYNLSASYPTWWEYVKSDLEPIIPIPNVFAPENDTTTGGISSVLVSRKNVQNGNFGKVIKGQHPRCVNQSISCAGVGIYQDITGNINSPQDSTNSVSPGMRNSLFHITVNDGSNEVMNTIFYPLGSNSYFGESAYNMPQWPSRLFGSKYGRLHAIKKSRDPNSLFWCRHCVGDTE